VFVCTNIIKVISENVLRYAANVENYRKRDIKSQINIIYFPISVVIFSLSLPDVDICVEKFWFVSDVLLCAEILENSNICTLGVIKKSQQPCQCIQLPHNEAAWKRVVEVRGGTVLRIKYRIFLSVEMCRKWEKLNAKNLHWIEGTIFQFLGEETSHEQHLSLLLYKD
jgi:hypothetical protein